MVLTLEQKVFVVSEMNSAGTVCELQRRFRQRFGSSLHHKTVKCHLQNFKTTGSLNRKKGSGSQKKSRTAGNVAAVKNKFKTDPRTSIRKAAVELGINRSSVFRIVKDEKLKPYKMNLVQALKPTDPSQRQRWSYMNISKLSDILML